MREFVSFLFSLLDNVAFLRPALSFLLVFFLPGFAWVLFLFNGQRINIAEKIALSAGISVALVTLSIIALSSLAGIPVTSINSFLTILALAAFPLTGYFLRKAFTKKKANN